MKTFVKKNWIFLVIVLFAALIRFYDFPDRVTFWTEQARSLIVSANYIKEKPSLLGQEYFRKDSNAHTIYSGAIFNYSLVPLLLISNYDPVTITFFFGLLNLFTGVVIYLVVKKIFGKDLALISTVLFLFNDFMIYHSLFIWNYNFLPLIGILILYFSWKYIKSHKYLEILLIGILCGIGISFQFLFAPIALLVFIFNVFKSNRKIIAILLFGLGIVLGNFPMFLFDLRHNFYNISTLFQYLFDTLKGRSDANFAYYYLLPFWPTFVIFGAFVINKITKWNKVAGSLLIILYLYINLTSSRVSFVSPLGMPKGLNVKDMDTASKMIASDAKESFNVAEVLDFDKQAYVLRYFVGYKYGRKPVSETEYQNLELLYVLGEKDYNFEKSKVWEIYSGGEYKKNVLSEVGEGYRMYKLSK